MSEAAGTVKAPEEAAATTADWIAVIGGALGALMASLDISIVSAALPQIQGEIGANGTEATWIGTGYLVAEVVMIPLTAWLTRLMGLRFFLLVAAISFVVFSILCGLAGSLPQMILGRVGQGFFGGALIPTAQVIVRTRLPLRQMPVGMSLFGVIVLVGPVFGPVIGGFLTEYASWHWCFFINLPVGMALVALLVLGLPKQKPDRTLLAKADWLGIIGMTIGFSCLTVIFEEGQRERWFESPLIVYLTLASLLGFIALTVAQMTNPDPFIKLSLLRNRVYASAIFIIVVIGATFYGITFILPQFLSGIAGYNSQQAGMILALSALPTFLLLPIMPLIVGRFDIRLMVALGLAVTAISCFVDFTLSPDSAGNDFVASQLLRGLGTTLSMMPLNQVAMASIGRESAADGAGLFNMARNLGGSIGLALFGVLIDRRAAVHSGSLRETLTANSLIGQERVAADGASQGVDAATAHLRMLAQLSREVERQALVVTYNDCFWILGVVIVAVIPLVLILRRPPMPGPLSSGH